MHCYLCKSKQIRSLYKIKKWNIFLCKDCSFVFLYPLLNKVQLLKIYNLFENNIFEKSLIILQDAKHSLKFISKNIKKTGDLLDIGCGNGIFLKEASRNLWKVTGIDISLKLIKYLKIHFEYKVIHGDILSVRLKNIYDLVTLNQVIEHFSKPKLLIKRCYGLLKSEGYIYIATPNISSTLSKVRKNEFDYIIPPEHLSYFNKKTLSKILIDEGFRIIKFSTWSYPVDLAGLIKHLLKRGSNLKSKNKGMQHKVQNFDIRRVKYFLFDQLFCRLFYKVLNINNGGTMIEVIAQKI